MESAAGEKEALCLFLLCENKSVERLVHFRKLQDTRIKSSIFGSVFNVEPAAVSDVLRC